MWVHDDFLGFHFSPICNIIIITFWSIGLDIWIPILVDNLWCCKHRKALLAPKFVGSIQLLELLELWPHYVFCRWNDGAGGDCSSGRICLNLSLSFTFFPATLCRTTGWSDIRSVTVNKDKDTDKDKCRGKDKDKHRARGKHKDKHNNLAFTSFFPRKASGHLICYAKFSSIRRSEYIRSQIRLEVIKLIGVSGNQ